MQRLTKNQLHDLKSLKYKKGREEQGRFIVEGKKMVEEALSSPLLSIDCIFYTESYEAATLHNRTSTFHVSPTEMQRISALKSPQEVLAVCQIPPFQPPVGKRILCLDGIQDPGNLGSILRVADWFGISEVVLSKGSVDCYNPKTVQASMGSIFRTAVHYTELDVFLQQTQLPVYGAVLEGTSIQDFTWQKESILVIGNESTGISPFVMPFLHNRITIPRFGNAESLNAAIASGILCAKWSGI
jgi:TrmH family RNA methyltransferase